MTTPSSKVGPLERPKVLRDPVHNLITLDGEEGALILGLLDRPEFQRLRRIRQMGLSFLTYPSAEHSRWVHSVGVYHIARRMLDVLRERHGSDSTEYQELKTMRREILVAALLHDIGHGPFSHLFEKAIKGPVGAPTGYPSKHEQWSQRIISERLGQFLQDNDVRVNLVSSLLDEKDRRYLLAKDFISSQLDADRMDYLLRDSKAVGAKYGEYDLEWLLHSVRIGKVQVRGQPQAVLRLCFDSRKAVHVVEEYIQAREFMYLQVYIHKTTRAYEALFKNILALAQRICDGDPAKAPQPCPLALAKMLARQPVSTDEYLSLDDFRIWTMLIDWSHPVESDSGDLARLRGKCVQLVNRQQPYKVIGLKSREMQDEALELITSLEGTPLGFSCHRDAFRDIAYRNVFYRKNPEDPEEEDRVIHFIDENGQTHPAEALSEVIDAISKIESKVYRLYYDEADKDLVAHLQAEEWLAKSVTTGSQEGA
jgi:HD superfamily phosphohydrolase